MHNDPFKAYVRHVNPGLGRFLELSGRDVRLARASGCVLETADGRRYDDWVSGFGAFNLGHNPDVLKEVIREHLASDVPNLYVENLNPFAGELASRLVRAAGPGFQTCFFCNSGSEAVEAALKTALVATGRPRIARAAGAYHGTTLGALACMGRGLYRDDFESVLADFPEVPFGDTDALERVLSRGDVAAFLVEPFQMESGARLATAEYLRAARDLCHRHGALFLLDEVHTGMGRTGSLFAWQRLGVRPDGFTLAKSLGGGMVPVGAAVMGEGIWERAFGTYLRSEVHSCSYGGNALGCRVATKALEVLGETSFLARVRQRGERLFGALGAALAGSPVVERITWLGLMGGIKLRHVDHPWLQWENLGLPELKGFPVVGALVVERLGRRGIMAQVCAHDWSVLRVEPPLTVDEAACDRFVDAVTAAVRWLASHL
jgi:acetylornithine/succinyldiaminopimelate/putrescine aminotransferase